jgi:O-antigen/teichoic acid export membrane protein
VKFLKSFSIYTTASFIEKGISFFLLPVFTFYLSPKDFGYLALITSLISFTQPLLTLGVPGAISVAYFRDDKTKFPSYFSSSSLLPLGIALILFLVLAIFRTYLFDYFHVSATWIIFIPIICFLSFINSLLLVYYQINNEPLKYVTFSLSNTILNISFSLLLVITFKQGFEGRLLSQYLSALLLFICAVYILYKRGLLVYKIEWENVRDSLMFGLPLIPHIIGGLVINMSDRLFIDHFFGKEALGIYNVGYVIGATISILCSAFANAIIPFSYELFNENTVASKFKVVKVYYLFIIFLVAVIFFVWLFTPLAFHYMIDRKFAEGSQYVIWVTLGYFFQGLYLLFANIIFYLKKTKILFLWSFFNVFINLTLNYFLVRKYGALGAAYTLCLSYFIFFVVISIVTHRLYPLPWLYFLKNKV